VYITDGANVIKRNSSMDANLTSPSRQSYYMEAIETGLSGSQTRKARLSVSGGTATALGADTAPTYAAQLWVEDISTVQPGNTAPIERYGMTNYSITTTTTFAKIADVTIPAATYRRLIMIGGLFLFNYSLGSYGEQVDIGLFLNGGDTTAFARGIPGVHIAWPPTKHSQILAANTSLVVEFRGRHVGSPSTGRPNVDGAGMVFAMPYPSGS
jgi:hypothetical protein